MGRYLFRLPDIGEGVAEAEIVAWHVQPGDSVREDQSLVDVMTDKATVDMTSPVNGVVMGVHGEIGSMLPVGSVLLELEIDGEGNAVAISGDAAPGAPISEKVLAQPAISIPVTPSIASPVPIKRKPAEPAPPAFTTRAASDPPLASPATRRRAFEMGVPLQFVPGRGPAGRISADDLDAYIASDGLVTVPGNRRYAPRDGINDSRIIGLRRKIAEKMQEAKRRIPHIAYVEEIDVTQLEALRQDLNVHKTPEQPKLTLLPFLMVALVRALPGFPEINARFDDDAGVLHAYEGIHIGIATQTPGGLMVPVVTHAETRDVWALASEVSRLGQAARGGSVSREDLGGSTITITSLGPLGGITTTPVINYPEIAIIGPNKIVERPMIAGGMVTIRKMMNLSSSFDHRIVDGHDAALFVQRLKRLIEHPALLFMD